MMPHTASAALLEACVEAGIDYIFANLGSDHPPIIEALAAARAEGRPAPLLVTCPNEMVALSAAQGHAQVSGRAQAVLVHVECGTQALGGAVHNAAKGRAPVLILAGASPFTQEGELPGSRNEFIQWIQDVSDQRGLVRGYMRYDNELRSGRNIKQMIHRALQFAHSDPKGPVYLMAAREVLEEEVPPVAIDPARWRPLAPAALAPEDAADIAAKLARAERPVVVTSYLGRNPEAVPRLARLCRTLAIGVLDSVPSALNFPADDPLYQGSQWNEKVQNPALAEADLVLVIESDVPWIPTVNRPSPAAEILHIDVDPLKEQMPLWYIGAARSFRADAGTALEQILAALETVPRDPAAIAERARHHAARHAARQAAIAARAEMGGAITGDVLTARLRRHLDAQTIVLSEGISHYQTILDQLCPSRPGSLIASGGGSLGWHGGAAIGVKLARPDHTVVALTGDGSYMFSVPSSVHWMARRYRTPFLQVIYNNGGWKSPKLSMLALHPDGFASRADEIGVSFAPAPDYAAIAAASGGAFARRVTAIADLDDAIADAFRAVREEGRAAVLDVAVTPL
jgi:acetolactate synthase-1/2/3 large subunit